VHCLHLGHGIVGDVAYTGDVLSSRMMLHAWILSLPFPPPLGQITLETTDPFPVRFPLGGLGGEDGGGSARAVGGISGRAGETVLTAARDEIGGETTAAETDIELVVIPPRGGETGDGLGLETGEKSASVGVEVGVAMADETMGRCEKTVSVGVEWLMEMEASAEAGVWSSQRDPEDVEALLRCLRG